MALLRVRKGPSEQPEWLVPDTHAPTLLGRDAKAAICVGGDSASRSHAKIRRKGGEWWIEDLGSRNGTIVDAERVEKSRLAEGTSVQIGATLLTFHPDELPEPPSASVVGTRPRVLLREECGVGVFLAAQPAMDRDVRLDASLGGAPLSAAAAEALQAAVEAARADVHPRLEPAIHAEIEADGLRLISRRRGEVDVDDAVLDAWIARPLGQRLALAHAIAEVALARAGVDALRAPLAPHQLSITEERGEVRVHLAAADPGPLLSELSRSLPHAPRYLAWIPPECVRGRSPAGAPQAVSYSLGAILYTLLTGQRVTGDVPHVRALKNHLELDPAPLSLLVPELDDEVSRLVAAMLAKDPASRPRELDEIGRTLLRARADLPADTAGGGESAPRDAGPRPAVGHAAETRRAPSPRAAPTAAAEGAPRAPRVETAGGRRARSRFLGSLRALPVWAAIWAAAYFGARWASEAFFLARGAP